MVAPKSTAQSTRSRPLSAWDRSASATAWVAANPTASRTSGRRSATTPPMSRATTLAMVSPAMRRPPVPSPARSLPSLTRCVMPPTCIPSTST